MHRLPIVMVLLFALSTSMCAQELAGCGVPLKSSQQQHYDEALRQYEAGHFTQSNDLLRRVAKQQPRSADVQFWLGMCAVRLDKPAAVRRHFTRLAELCPDYPDARAHLYHAIILYTDDQFDDAVGELNRFFEIANSTSNPAYDAVYAEASNYLYWSQFLAEAYRNQPPFDPQPVRGVSTPDEEMLPYLAPDGQSLFFLRQMALTSGRTFYAPSQSKKVWQLCVSHLHDTVFDIGQPLPSPFNQYEGEGSVSLTADGNELFYSVLRYESDGYANVDIYCTRRRPDGSWSPVSSVGSTVNGKRSWESQPSVSPDGQWLYFASNRKGGYGGIDIWRSHRNADGTWGRAENLGPSVNTPLNEKCPHLHADGMTLYFASNGWQGFGGYDFYFIRLGDTYLQRPTNLGLPINGEEDDIGLGVSTDGGTAYYARHDIFRFDLYPAARPEPMCYRQGILTDSAGSPLRGTVTVERAEADAMHYPTDSATGRYAAMLSLQHENIVIGSAENHVPVSVRVKSAAARTDRPLQMTLAPVRIGGHYPIGPSVETLVNFLLEHPTMHVCIEATSAAEAKAMYDRLVEHHLRRERLAFRGGTDITQLQFRITQM